MPLGKRTDCGDAKYAGVLVPFPKDRSIDRTLQDCVDCGFDFIAAPLKRVSEGRPAPLAHQNALLVPAPLSGQVVGVVDSKAQPDAGDSEARQHDALVLRQELEWAAHLGLQACILQLQESNVALAHVLNQVLAAAASKMVLWLQIPLAASSSNAQPQHSPPSTTEANGHHQPGNPLASFPPSHVPSSNAATDPNPSKGSPTPATDPWHWWNRLRCLCSHSSKLGIILEIPAKLPAQECIERWTGEPVRAVLLPTRVFQTNKRGYPALSRAHQAVVSAFFQLNVQVLLSDADSLLQPEAYPGLGAGPGAGATAAGQGGSAWPQQLPLQQYHEYLSFLFRRQEEAKPEQMLELSYRDYLQAPLQPLQDNLESQTYETFEKDDTKYSTYQAAIHAALLDQPAKADQQAVIIMVVGAGRGPLIRASLQAGAEAGRLVKVWAVEKNPNAIIHIHHLVAASGWQDVVTVVSADMRRWEAPEKADMLVSELLGSFGDNELSPECLDGAQRFLREGGVSIPTSYTSFLQPITSVKLWNDVKAYDDPKQFETPFVAKLHRFTPLAAPQPVFTFQHPRQDLQNSNDDECHLSFEGPSLAGICHGFAGYFDAVLYGQVHLSILPSTHTPGMFSWFPIYFPVQQPVQLAAGQGLDMSIWRCNGNYKVWYEWCISSPQPTKIHNTNGSSYFVGL